MFMPKADIRKILQFLFHEGVMVCKNDVDSVHPGTGVNNLHVMQLMRSLESQDLIRRKYAWRHHYYFLKDEGVAWVRRYLHIPDDVVPLTHQKHGDSHRIETDVRERGPRREERTYRGNDKAPAPAGFGSAGRGAGTR